jgi:hypothetical protein
VPEFSITHRGSALGTIGKIVERFRANLNHDTAAAPRLACALGGWVVRVGQPRGREAANMAMRVACKAEGLLFLDHTVELSFA